MVARLHRQQVPRRPEPVRRRHGGASPKRTRLARLRPRCRSFPKPRACRPRTRSASASRQPRADGAGDASPCRACRASPISTISTRCARARRAARVRPAGRAAAGRRSRHPAGHQGDDRRPRLLPRAGLGHRSSRPCRAAAAACSASAAATRCWAAASPTARASRDRPARSMGLGLLDVETCSRREDAARRSRAFASPTARRSRLRDACRADGRPGLRAAAASVRRRRADGAVSADGRVAGAYVHGLFADDRQRAPGSPRSAAASDLAYEATVEATLDALADHLERASRLRRAAQLGPMT